MSTRAIKREVYDWLIDVGYMLFTFFAIVACIIGYVVVFAAVIAFAAFIVCLPILVFGAVIYVSWNYAVHPVFAMNTMTFTQACLIALLISVVTGSLKFTWSKSDD